MLRRAASTTDFTDLQIGGQPGQQDLPIHVIGPLADQSPAQAKTLPLVQLGGAMGKDALTVTSAKVTVEGVYIKGGRAGLVCLGSGAQLRVVRSFITGADTGVYAASGCQLTVEQSWFGRGPAQGVYSETVGNKRSIEIASADFAISGSVFADNGDFRTDSFGGVRVRSLTAGKTTRSSLINNTFFQQSGLLKTGKYYTGVLCDSVAGDRLAVVNTLFLTEMPLLTTPYHGALHRSLVRRGAVALGLKRSDADRRQESGAADGYRGAARWTGPRSAPKQQHSAVRERRCATAGFQC
jgi:hypothetical protein